MSELNTDFITRWVAALRSGEYQQATGVLKDRTTGGYCCLGVACDLLIADGVLSGWEPPRSWMPQPQNALHAALPPDRLVCGGVDTTELPEAALAAIGFSKQPIVTVTLPEYDRPVLRKLWACNDMEGMSFAQIASVIESNFLTPAEQPKKARAAA